jgi:hypothetical protein
MGTFSLEATAGEIATLNFTFTGNYVAPTAAAFPTTEVYAGNVPPLVEFSSITFFGEAALIANSLSLDLGNTVTPRSDMNAAAGFRGVRVSGRAPSGGHDPEARSADTFYASFTGTSANRIPTGPLQARIGGRNDGTNNGSLVAGQTIQIDAPACQITALPYADRDGLRTYDLSFALRRGNAGNDEMTILFA